MLRQDRTVEVVAAERWRLEKSRSENQPEVTRDHELDLEVFEEARTMGTLERVDFSNLETVLEGTLLDHGGFWFSSSTSRGIRNRTHDQLVQLNRESIETR